jgi:TolB-like protein/Tfp pilus assembly protein PilF
MRQLTAIMFTDMVGFTAMMQENETRARAAVDRHRAIVRRAVDDCRGDLVQFYGDGTLSVFASAVDAVDCALKVQQEAAKPPSVALRIGLHTGDVVHDEGSVFGDGVNVAARIQGLGVSGSVLLSAKLRDEIKNQPRFQTRVIGAFDLRNVQQPMRVFALTNEGLAVPRASELPRPANGQSSVAVLPFVNMSADPENEYFADGVTEEVINVLTRIEGLKVTARTSSFVFKGHNVDIREIGEQLGVSHVLEGSVRKAGDRVRVTAQLITTRDGYHLFSDVYDRRIEDIFATQDDIAAAIAEALREHLGSGPRPEKRSGADTRDVRAHERYLRGLHFWNKYTPQAARTAIGHFQAAASLDGDWAPPRFMEASALVFLCTLGYEPPKRGFPQAEAAAQEAVRLGPALGESHMAVALVQFFYDWDFDEAEESFERALSLTPGSANVHQTLAMLREAQGRHDEAIRLMRRAVELDPLSLIMLLNLGRAYLMAGRLDEAAAQAEHVLELDPGFRAARGGLGWVHLARGDAAAAIECFEALPRQTGDPYNAAAPRALAYAAAGREDDARAMLELLERRAEEHPELHLHMDFALAHNALGEAEKALDALEGAAEARQGTIAMVPNDPTWTDLRSHPRFQALMQRAGLSRWVGP